MISGGTKDIRNDYTSGFSCNIVIDLTENIPIKQSFKIFTENWFSFLKLFVALKQKGHWILGTTKNDLMSKWPTKTETELQKSGEEGSAYREKTQNGLSYVVKWPFEVARHRSN